MNDHRLVVVEMCQFAPLLNIAKLIIVPSRISKGINLSVTYIFWYSLDSNHPGSTIARSL
jgi:hypothetical protein